MHITNASTYANHKLFACVPTTILLEIYIALAFLISHILICKSLIAQLLAIDNVDILYKNEY